MPIPTKTPITPVEPEKNYDHVAFTFSISPLPEPGEAVLALMWGVRWPRYPSETPQDAVQES